MRDNKNDVCFCETCLHDKASVCIESFCNCCSKADKIRLEHTTVSADDFSSAELERRRAVQEEYERREAEQLARSKIGF